MNAVFFLSLLVILIAVLIIIKDLFSVRMAALRAK